MRILITGVCGFVGSALVECLLERVEGIRVTGMDNLIRPGAETNRVRIERLGVEFIHGDLRSASDIASLPPCEWVIDAAANPSVLAGHFGAGSSRRLFEHNLAGFGNVLEYCREHKAGLFLLSSSRVYSIPALAAIPLCVRRPSLPPRPSRPATPRLNNERHRSGLFHPQPSFSVRRYQAGLGNNGPRIWRSV